MRDASIAMYVGYVLDKPGDVSGCCSGGIRSKRRWLFVHKLDNWVDACLSLSLVLGHAMAPRLRQQRKTWRLWQNHVHWRTSDLLHTFLGWTHGGLPWKQWVFRIRMCLPQTQTKLVVNWSKRNVLQERCLLMWKIALARTLLKQTFFALHHPVRVSRQKGCNLDPRIVCLTHQWHTVFDGFLL